MISPISRQKWSLLLVDVACILLATQLSPLVRSGQMFYIFIVNTGASVFSLTLYLLSLYIFDLYNTDRDFHSTQSLGRIIIAIATAGFFCGFLFYSFPSWKYGRGHFLIQMVLVLLFVGGWRWIFSMINPIELEKKNCIVLGAGKSGNALYKLLETTKSPFHIVGFLDDDITKQGNTIGSSKVLGKTELLLEMAERYGVAVTILAITHDRSAALIRRILEAKLKGISILEMPKVFEMLVRRVPVKHIQDDWLTFTDGFFLIGEDYIKKIKRLFDLVFSAFLIFIISPVILVTALAIKLESSGPVFFKQERVGKNGEVFELYKFRSMYKDAEQNGAVWADKSDSRVTRVGRVIRFLRIDELPQLWNIFRGEMSLIGPRPERPEFVSELTSEIPYYDIRHSVQPGITGWAQINYPYGASVEDALGKLEYDIYYVKNMSLLLDFKIFLRTIGVVLFGQGSR